MKTIAILILLALIGGRLYADPGADLSAAIEGADVPKARAALDAGANPNGTENSPTRPLLEAAYLGSPDLVALLLAHHANVDAGTDEGWTPLDAAARTGNVRVVKMLINAGARSDAAGALMAAVEMGNAEVVALLCQAGASVQFSAADGRTAVHLAAARNDAKSLQVLIAAGADINTFDNQGNRPIALAALGDAPATARILIEHHSALDPSQSFRLTPIQIAQGIGALDIVNLLTPGLADVHGNPGALRSTLVDAIRAHDKARIQKLLAGNVDLSHIDDIPTDMDPAEVATVPHPDPLAEAIAAGDAATIDLLLAHKADPSATDNMNNAALVAAAKAGNEALVRKLLSLGANVDKPFHHTTLGTEALMAAVAQNSLPIAKDLLEKGVDPNRRGYYLANPLSSAASAKKADMVQFLLDHGAKPSAIEGLSMSEAHPTPQAVILAVAALHANQETTRERHTQQDAQAQTLGPALIAAAEAGRADEVARLAARGADPNLKDDMGWPPLVLAAAKGHTGVVLVLLDHGVKPDVRGPGNWTALMQAAANDHADTVDLLLQRGARVYAQSDWGLTAADYAAQRAHASPLAALQKAASAAIDPRPALGAQELGDANVWAFLLKQKIDVNIGDDLGWTPLFHAIHDGRTDQVDFLLEHGADIRKTDAFGRPPLIFSLLGTTMRSNPQNIYPYPDFPAGVINYTWLPYQPDAPRIVESLLRHGADPDAVDQKGLSARDVAKTVGKFDPGMYAMAQRLASHDAPAGGAKR